MIIDSGLVGDAKNERMAFLINFPHWNSKLFLGDVVLIKVYGISLKQSLINIDDVVLLTF